MAERKPANTDKAPPEHPCCPFVHTPFPDCYCLEMDSGRISRVLDYCYDQFQQCPIYRRELSATSQDGTTSTPSE